MSGKDPDYSFFENFESCYKIECKKEQANFVTEYTNYCKDTQFTYNNGNQVVHICKNMVKLYNSAILEHGYSKKHFTQNNVPEFINYWINKELTKAGINDDMRSQFCKKLDSITHNFDNQQLLKNKIYDIKKKDVKAMNILYEFYKIFYELAQKGNNYLQDFLVNFRKNYNEGLIKCFNGADVKFCHELNKYIKFYEQRKGQLSNICDNNKCPSLKKLTLLLSPSKKELLNIAENGYKLIGSLHISYLDGLYSTETDDVY
ncbi:variable surface protein Vir5-related [Plasmodium vivax]|uniref:Variable surface protein Vir5-related n=1 Tax=Plasmodium vivax (strain Salvador I) TaxID=126793 RepID=A5KD06_PLAVS|nr:variable surface protein Vir5-related [Plasmodium vivax]EDL42764.1 variable surface protein Vir5-related [Plasmodium vivax]|eukprot:XP_001612557.1 variable surface protein Vir5-related [Plasmodium vivax Sal-1]